MDPNLIVGCLTAALNLFVLLLTRGVRRDLSRNTQLTQGTANVVNDIYSRRPPAQAQTELVVHAEEDTNPDTLRQPTIF